MVEQYAIITENDESQWHDQTGILYHFPARYSKILSAGTKLIYYKGGIKKSKYGAFRKSKKPHYFGVATMGQVYPDKSSSKNDFFGAIVNFQEFVDPVLAKINDSYFEIIPENRKQNYWRDGVRKIDKSTYDKIISNVTNIIVKTTNVDSDLNDRDLDHESYVTEGSKTKVYVTKYERNPKLRDLAIALHGTKCCACGFDFGATYGEYAEGFIHIHHCVPLHEVEEEIVVNPQTDLVPLCANCHAVIHRRKKQTLSVQDLKAMLNH